MTPGTSRLSAPQVNDPWHLTVPHGSRFHSSSVWEWVAGLLLKKSIVYSIKMHFVTFLQESLGVYPQQVHGFGEEKLKQESGYYLQNINM